MNIDVKTELLCTLQVSLTDHGRWMCLMNENSTFNSVKQWLDLAVAVVPSTGVTLTLAGDSEHDADTGEEQLLLSYHLFHPLLITFYRLLLLCCCFCLARMLPLFSQPSFTPRIGSITSYYCL